VPADDLEGIQSHLPEGCSSQSQMTPSEDIIEPTDEEEVNSSLLGSLYTTVPMCSNFFFYQEMGKAIKDNKRKNTSDKKGLPRHFSKGSSNISFARLLSSSPNILS
jgi:hypothetical protein